MTTLTNKDPAESFAVSFDFASLLTEIATTAVSASITSGRAGDASAILSGAAQIDGTTVLQRVIGGQPGTDYLLRCQATSGAETYVLTALLPVRTAGEQSSVLP